MLLVCVEGAPEPPEELILQEPSSLGIYINFCANNTKQKMPKGIETGNKGQGAGLSLLFCGFRRCGLLLCAGEDWVQKDESRT